MQDLHEIIFMAYDRYEEHMYEFHFGKSPMNGPRCVLPMAFDDSFIDDDSRPAGRVDQTTLDSLRLKVGRTFGYWFDFGDDWYHQINVEAIEDDLPPGKYPVIVKSVGVSPPQYLDVDE